MDKKLFKKKCEQYLFRQSIMDLRAYGRYLNLLAPTTLKKEALIKEIIQAICGEIVPQRGKRGAPIKNSYVEPQIIEEVEKLKKEYGFDETEEIIFDKISKIKEKDSNFVLQINFSIENLSLDQKRSLNSFLNSLLK
ncbi:MAG: hypothetical protein E7364_07390 [Clostridiales bacterium]|nr:hypothetical protein [Clostridiales bacterium]